MPKRPQSAFLLYAGALRKAQAIVSGKEGMRAAGPMWAVLDASEKAKYEKKAESAFTVYREAMEAYREEHGLPEPKGKAAKGAAVVGSASAREWARSVGERG